MQHWVQGTLSVLFNWHWCWHLWKCPVPTHFLVHTNVWTAAAEYYEPDWILCHLLQGRCWSIVFSRKQTMHTCPGAQKNETCTESRELQCAARQEKTPFTPASPVNPHLTPVKKDTDASQCEYGRCIHICDVKYPDSYRLLGPNAVARWHESTLAAFSGPCNELCIPFDIVPQVAATSHEKGQCCWSMNRCLLDMPTQFCLTFLKIVLAYSFSTQYLIQICYRSSEASLHYVLVYCGIREGQ